MFGKTLLDKFSPVVSWLRSSEMVAGLVLAVFVGLVSGLGAVAFRWLINNFHSLFFNGGRQILSFLGDYYIILIPAVGGLLVGLLVYFFAREAKGHGVPEVMEAVALKGGRIRPRVSLVKALASSICIGSGGSVGREGPIVQIGSSFGSSIGQWLKLPDETVKMLVACGAAGGIAATFNAPIAGVFFALEVILGRVVTRRFAYVVISAVAADFTAQAFLGNTRAFDIPAFGIVSPWEFLFYGLLGVLAAFAAQAFTRILYWSEDRFDSLKIPEYLKPVLGGLAVGAIGLYSFDLFGVGYEGITKALSGDLGVLMLLSLLVLKIAATSLTLGSGGSGGIFAPSLFIGAMLGAAVGSIFGGFFPSITAPTGAYGVVGMAAVFAGAARAPFSAILIIFEMTNDYAIMLPLMTAVVISTLVSRTLKRESIYTLKLLRRGVDIEQEEMTDIMRSVTVKEAMTKDFPTVPATMKIDGLVRVFQKTGHHGFPVVDKNGFFAGLVTQTDLERQLGAASVDKMLTAGDIAARHPFVAYPDQYLDRLLDNIDEAEARIPVVSREDSHRLLGVLGRHEIIAVYRKKTRKRLPPKTEKR
ncbi:MAG: chloride channel protein [Dehalococcoidales bacterium]